MSTSVLGVDVLGEMRLGAGTSVLGVGILGEMRLGAAPPGTPTGGISFVLDRTQAHVDLLKELTSKRWVDLTPEERIALNGEAAKGAYNYTDLNRVETAVATLAVELGLSLTTKTNWTLWDVPTQSDMSRYLRNVVTLRDSFPEETNFPPLPDSMSNLTWEYANNIEMVLFMVYTRFSITRSGEIYCGEV